MQVRGEIRINYNVDKAKWEGNIYIYLPARKEDGYCILHLVPELRNPSVNILGYSLNKRIGSEDKNSRKIWKSYEYDANLSILKVQEDLEKILKEEIDKIKKVYKENLFYQSQSYQKEYEFNF